jgi:hypothetical protein
MKSAVSSLAVPLLAVVSTLLLTSTSQAAVCYNPQGRGLSVSRYQLDTLTSGWLSAPMDFASDPWEVAGSEFLDYARPDVFAAFERRYGPRTACLGGLTALPACGGHVFKRFAGPGNEVRSFLVDALAWWAAHSPASLGGGVGCWSNGVPSEQEVTDLQAVSDNPIWEEYHRLALPGGSAGRRQSVCRPERAAGAFDERDSFWGWTNYLFNTCGQTTVPPRATSCSAPPKAVLDAARRVRNQSTAKAAGQIVIDWLNAARACTGG